MITIFPDFFHSSLDLGVVGKAIQAEKITLETINPRAYTEDFHQSVDDRPFGGGDGMVMMGEPLMLAVEDLRSRQVLGEVIYLSPQGHVWNDDWARKTVQRGSFLESSLSSKGENSGGRQSDGKIYFTLVCGRYAGIDFRWIQEVVNCEISIGDYVLSGGELPAMILIDSLARFVPGVLGNAESPHNESFYQGLLEAPQYTRPRLWREQSVPEVLLSGDHKKIEDWRKQISLLRTALLRPDLIEDHKRQEAIRAALGWAEKQSSDELAVSGLSRGEIQKIRESLGE